jgi:hypothetical protein
MRNTLVYAGLTILLLVTINQISAGVKSSLEIPVEVVGIKELGISANDKTKTIIEVRWENNSAFSTSVSSFKLNLSVTYTDGTTFNEAKKAESKATSERFEVPTAKVSKNKPAAGIKKMNAIALAVLPEKTN